MKQGYVIIGFWVVLLVAALIIISVSISEEQESSLAYIIEPPATNHLPVEEGQFKLSARALAYMQQEGLAISSRTLTSYYNQRAYPGAPPTIPHPIDEKQNMGGNACLQCHENGGYVAKFKAFTPVTPHADYINCKQCHVAVTTSTNFKPNNWQQISAPELKQQAMTGSPPIIPHDLAMRNNCLACHAGAAAPKEIRVTHPNRVNCRQCHALNDNSQKTPSAWIRK